MFGRPFQISNRLWGLLAVAISVAAVICVVRRDDFFGYVGRNYILQNDLTRLEALIANRPKVATDLLEVAFKEGHRDAYVMLLGAGANPSQSWIRNRWGSESLVHKAAERQDSFWLEQALKHGADPNQHDNPNGVYPLTYAIQSRIPENARLLITHNADVDAYGGRGESMVSFALSQGEFETVLLLLNHGVDINPPSLIAKSFLFRMQHHLKGIQGKVTFETAEKTGTLPYLDKILAWFDEQRLDWRNATYDKSTGNVPKTWDIPRLPEP
jgi:hypothetical protein